MVAVGIGGALTGFAARGTDGADDGFGFIALPATEGATAGEDDITAPEDTAETGERSRLSTAL